MQLSVVIVHYKVPAHLEQCLFSLKCALEGVSAEVIVVDNGPALSAQPELSNRFPDVRWITAGNNLGFAAGCNLGWQKATGEKILFLNPDTLVTSSAIGQCLTALESADAVGCRLINGRGFFLPESKRNIPQLRSAFFKITGLATIFPSSPLFNQYAMGEMDERSSGDVNVLTGAFMLVRRGVLEKLGGFDESFFLYGEDIDFCKRMKEAGFVIRYEGGKAVIHCKGASSSDKGSAYFHHFYRAMSVYAGKYYIFPVSALLQLIILVWQWLHRILYAGKKILFPPPSVDLLKSTWLLIGEKNETEVLAGIMRNKWGQGLLLSEADLASTDPKSWRSENRRIVFCIGKLPLESVIQQVQQTQGASVTMYWHFNSCSMAGSGYSYLFCRSLFEQEQVNSIQ